MIHAIDPVTITTLDGEQRKLLLSLGALRRLKKRFAVETLQELLARDVADLGPPLLYESLPKSDRDAITEEQFGELIPADVAAVGRIVLKLIGVSLPDARPTEAPVTEPAATMTTSDSGPTGASS